MYGTVAQKYDERLFLSLADVVLQEDGEGNTTATLDDTNLYPVTFSSSTAFYTFSKSKGELIKDSSNGAGIVSFEDALSGASKVYISSVDGTPKFIITIVD